MSSSEDEIIREKIKYKVFQVKYDEKIKGDSPDITIRFVDPFYFIMKGNYFLDFIYKLS